MKWTIAQYWHHVMFLNYKVDQKWLLERIPKGLELDLYNGQAYLSVIPFRMEGVRFRWTPVLPWSSMWEINLRTYVKVGNKPGIFFLTLDTDHLLGEWIAQNFFQLPYRFKSLRANVLDQNYIFDSGEAFYMESKTTTVPLVVGPYHEWLAERYFVYSNRGAEIWRGEVLHEPWTLKYAKLETLREGLCQEFFPHASVELDSVFYSPGLPVRFLPFEKLF